MELPELPMEIVKEADEKKPKRVNKSKEKIMNIIKRSFDLTPKNVYEDILEESIKKGIELDKERNKNVALQRELDELMQGLLNTRLNNLN